MKKINRLIASIFAIGAMFTMTSCEQEEFTYKGDNFIHYQKESYQVNENATAIVNIPVFLATTSHPGTTTAQVNLSGDAVEGEHYNVIGGNTLSFAEGVYSDTIKIQLIDNDVVDGNKVINLAIGSNSANYTIGYPGTESKSGSTVVTIIDNDCPFVASNFVGTFNASYNNLAGTDPYSAKSDITQDPEDPTVFLVTNFWGEGKTVRVTLDEETLTGVIPLQNFETGNFYGYGPAVIESLATTVAPLGTIIPCENKFTVTFRVRVSAGSFGNYRATFTK
ncbi:Calx-beta domain-containing protein [uncultured Pontibacter sp.]|uniref:Calx-beta domain-containing protein n=1 Tax=uncultured Pontibacter sp. TaxID=453356 RepID=UPI00261454A6|nr:Calx-beta domain-containing protein [uncultured Pontibacter sp.]